MLSGTITLDKRVIVRIRDCTHKALHLFGCRVYDFVCSHCALKLVTVVLNVLRKDEYLGHLVDAELFAQLLLLEAVDGADLDHAVETRANGDVILLKLPALIQLGVKEVDYPDLLSAVELEYPT